MRISHSRIGTWQDCQQLYFYRYVARLTEMHTPPPLATGSAMHAGLAVLKTTEDIDKARAEATLYYDKLVVEESKFQQFLPQELAAVEDQKNWIHSMLVRFRNQCQVPDWQLLMPEVKGEVQLGNSPHVLVLVIDGLIQWLGRLWILEYKTKRRVN